MADTRILGFKASSLRKPYYLLRAIIFYPELLLVRQKVRKTVGKKLFNAIVTKNVVIFPNYVAKASSIRSGGYVLSKIMLVCGITPRVFAPHDIPDIVIDWQDTTHSTLDCKAYINYALSQCVSRHRGSAKTFINSDCTDISKSKISELYFQVFENQLEVNPTTFTGLMVRKSDQNGLHDGVVVRGPIRKDEILADCVYSVLVDNTVENTVRDYRLIYIGGLLDFFYEKTRPTDNRFANKNSRVTLRYLNQEFSLEEIEKISRFCKNLNVDYCELDVLRDRNTHILYIIDCAKTPAGPPNGLARKDSRYAIEKMSVAFFENIW